jgi:hypothetical protein
MKTWSEDELAAFVAFEAQDREVVLYHVAAATGLRAANCSAYGGGTLISTGPDCR